MYKYLLLHLSFPHIVPAQQTGSGLYILYGDIYIRLQHRQIDQI